jgi:NAD-reducing hydrogenase large subunit
MAVRIPAAARKLRELLHCAQFVQSHALSFFYLSSPDLLLGMDSDPAKRNVVGVIEKHPELARLGIELRKYGLQIIEGLAQERVHPSWAVPGGVNAPLSPQVRDRIAAELPHAIAAAERTLAFFKGAVGSFQEEIDNFGSTPTMYAGTVDAAGNLQLYDGKLRFRSSTGAIVHDGVEAEDYASFIGEASLTDSYLKAPYYKPAGYPAGIYRVGPLARLNVAERCGTPKADIELAEFRQRFGNPAHSSFLFHYARLIELLYALERIEQLLDDPQIMQTHVRAHAGVNSLEGVGIVEAPRGVLIHNYKVNEDGGITWANLIVATGHNNLAIGKAIQQVSEHWVDGTKLQEGMLNRVSAVVRAYDPCFSCSTHASGQLAMQIRLFDPQGKMLDELYSR